ncbi:DeoR/GlpR transcriptional regulator [Clostridium sp. NSJ-49]|jgi:DeoR family fructose operon transcriptional repressor|uniref:DeoR/GlpR family DNA-binding transcription regulator n=1 Tax=Clostridium TaxID=1485 RepID=UPI00164B3D1F|nr:MULTISPECIES: DeoR/GlpR family DNA-binding transcription regulator [unclassified Clostridium]MBC5627095.1 DeoR/GlpR transcriptional regulator [Clostridium sp. NSJ-49]MCD2502098.1 DeoR/GlpR family DNA-binding transcription regulator [Clostridium sp. NSJ-145]
MLTQERHALILEKLEKESVVYLSDLINLLDASESTIRRDLNYLDKAGLLKKVHGGATSLNSKLINTTEFEVEVRQGINKEEKIAIAKYAASLIKNDDLIYIDSGTTTELMIDFIEAKGATFVTNGIGHAKKLIHKNLTTYILGGELKLTTEAIIGIEAINSLRKYNFTKGFFGANGIDIERGFTTPDIREAMVKEEALKKSKLSFVLADNSKFNEVSSITFGEISNTSIITTKLEDIRFKKVTKIVEVDE